MSFFGLKSTILIPLMAGLGVVCIGVTAGVGWLEFADSKALVIMIAGLGLLAVLGLAFFLVLRKVERRLHAALDRVMAESQASETHVRFLQGLMETIPSPLFYKDTQGRYLDCNSAFARHHGLTREQIIGKTVDDLADPKLAQLNKKMDQFLLDGVGPQTYEQCDLGPDGAVRHMLFHKATYTDAQGQVAGIVGVITDITDRKAAEDAEERNRRQLEHEATHDVLTGLPNRANFHHMLERELDRCRSEKGYAFAVLFLDFDRFKLINDTLGHAVGDEFLRQIAQRLGDWARQQGAAVDMAQLPSIARLGGDEFTILLPGARRITQAAGAADRFREVLGQPFPLGGHEITARVSIGIVLADAHYENSSEVICDADIAMYRAKSEGGNRHVVFDPSMREELRRFVEMERDLLRAIDSHQFSLHYQPIVSLATGKLYAFEALIRWNHPQRGLVSPDQFIPLAEETGLIVPLGWWVLQEACAQIHQWRETFGPDAPTSISVNLAKRQLADPLFVGQVLNLLQDHQLPASCLELEVTESVMLDDADAVLTNLAAFRQAGIHLMMDDFGTGQSSLSRLHKFPINTVKIDRAFLRNVLNNRSYAAVLSAIVALTHNLGLMVVAEGVEAPEQVAQLIDLDCDYAQGYLFSRPVPAADAEKLIAQPLLTRRNAG